MNHEISFVCPVCGEEYDAHLHWHICPKCGTDADKEIVAEKRYAIANFVSQKRSIDECRRPSERPDGGKDNPSKQRYMALHYFLKMIVLVALLVLAILAWRGFGWAFIAEVVVLGIAAVAEILVALSIVATEKDLGERREE